MGEGHLHKKNKSFLEECKGPLQTLMELILKTVNGKEHKLKVISVEYPPVTAGHIPNIEEDKTEITGKQTNKQKTPREALNQERRLIKRKIKSIKSKNI